MRTITRLAGWTFGWVVANQVALVVILALADGARSPGRCPSYTYAYTFFQLPYGVVAVSVMTAVTPSLPPAGPTDDMAGFRHRMAFGLRGILAIIIPSAVGMVILCPPPDRPGAGPRGRDVGRRRLDRRRHWPCSPSASPGFCTFLYMVRVFQAMQDTRTAFRLYLVENGINIVFGVALVGPARGPGPGPLPVDRLHGWPPCWPSAVVRSGSGGLGGDDLTTPVKRVLGRVGE